MNRSRDIIKFVGGLDFGKYMPKNTSDEDKKEIEDAIKETCIDSKLSAYILFPNFFPGNLSNSQGFVARLPRKQLFLNCDVYNGEKFRVMMCAELNITELSLDTAEKVKEIIKTCFPVVSHVPPTLVDTPGSGWHPALGSRGSSIGIYSTTEVNTKENKMWTRYFVVCHSSLPDATIDAMLEHDHQTVLNNRRNTDYYSFIRNSQVSAIPVNVTKPTYNYEEFARGSVNDRMSNIAIENCRRLIVIFSELTGLPLKSRVSGYVKDSSIGTDVAIGDKLYGPGYPYRKIRGSEKYTDIDSLFLKKVNSYWPEGVPIYSFSRLPNTVDLPEQYRDYPIGQIYHEGAEDDPDILIQTEDVNKFIMFPKTTEEDLFTEYNTFRNSSKDSSVVWYSHCTPTDFAEKGIMINNGLELGYSVINPSFFNQFGKGDFQNNADNAFPVSFPFIKNKSRDISPATLKIFFDSYNTKKPLQLLGTYDTRQKLMESSIVREALYPKTKTKVVELTPNYVLLSRLPIGIEYELTN